MKRLSIKQLFLLLVAGLPCLLGSALVHASEIGAPAGTSTTNPIIVKPEEKKPEIKIEEKKPEEKKAEELKKEEKKTEELKKTEIKIEEKKEEKPEETNPKPGVKPLEIKKPEVEITEKKLSEEELNKKQLELDNLKKDLKKQEEQLDEKEKQLNEKELQLNENEEEEENNNNNKELENPSKPVEINNNNNKENDESSTNKEDEEEDEEPELDQTTLPTLAEEFGIVLQENKQLASTDIKTDEGKILLAIESKLTNEKLTDVEKLNSIVKSYSTLNEKSKSEQLKKFGDTVTKSLPANLLVKKLLQDLDNTSRMKKTPFGEKYETWKAVKALEEWASEKVVFYTEELKPKEPPKIDTKEETTSTQPSTTTITPITTPTSKPEEVKKTVEPKDETVNQQALALFTSIQLKAKVLRVELDKTCAGITPWLKYNKGKVIAAALFGGLGLTAAAAYYYAVTNNVNVGTWLNNSQIKPNINWTALQFGFLANSSRVVAPHINNGYPVA